eukprot:gene30558-39374_t
MDSGRDQYQMSSPFVSMGGPDSMHGSGTQTSTSVGAGLGLVANNGGSTNGVGSNSNYRLLVGSGGPNPFKTAVTDVISWTML